MFICFEKGVVMKIGIIENNSIFAKSLKDILVLKKYDVYLFENYPIFFKYRNIDTFDVIILDIYLDDRYAVLILEKIRSLNLFATLIIVTVRDRKLLEEYDDYLNSFYILEKPFHFEQLETILDQIKKITYIINNFVLQKDINKNVLVLLKIPEVKILKNFVILDLNQLKNFDFKNSKDKIFYLNIKDNFMDYFYYIFQIVERKDLKNKFIININENIDKIKEYSLTNRLLENFLFNNAYLVSCNLSVS